jgi:hypothetical protein
MVRNCEGIMNPLPSRMLAIVEGDAVTDIGGRIDGVNDEAEKRSAWHTQPSGRTSLNGSILDWQYRRCRWNTRAPVIFYSCMALRRCAKILYEIKIETTGGRRIERASVLFKVPRPYNNMMRLKHDMKPNQTHFLPTCACCISLSSALMVRPAKSPVRNVTGTPRLPTEVDADGRSS